MLHLRSDVYMQFLLLLLKDALGEQVFMYGTIRNVV